MGSLRSSRRCQQEAQAVGLGDALSLRAGLGELCCSSAKGNQSQGVEHGARAHRGPWEALGARAHADTKDQAGWGAHPWDAVRLRPRRGTVSKGARLKTYSGKIVTKGHFHLKDHICAGTGLAVCLGRQRMFSKVSKG